MMEPVRRGRPYTCSTGACMHCERRFAVCDSPVDIDVVAEDQHLHPWYATAVYVDRLGEKKSRLIFLCHACLMKNVYDAVRYGKRPTLTGWREAGLPPFAVLYPSVIGPNKTEHNTTRAGAIATHCEYLRVAWWLKDRFNEMFLYNDKYTDLFKENRFLSLPTVEQVEKSGFWRDLRV